VLLRAVSLQMRCLALRDAGDVLLQKPGDDIRSASISAALNGDASGVTLSKWQIFCFSSIAIGAKVSPRAVMC